MSATITLLRVSGAAQSATPSPLVREIDRIKASQARPHLRVVRNEVRPRGYWKGRYNAALWAQRKATCPMCLGTGEVRVFGDFGEYEQPEPCPRCQGADPRPNKHDDVPF